MGSPFRTFRKYQKTALVIAGVGLMLVFVLGDPLSQLIQNSAQSGATSGEWSPTSVAVEWNDGRLTNQELELLVMRRRILNAVLGTIHQFGVEQYDPTELPPLQVEVVAQVRTAERGVEQDVLQTRLFADEARKAGMRISDESIRRYLILVGRSRVPTSAIQEIITKGFGQQRVTVDYVFEALREELLARNYLASYMYAWQTVLPEQQWRDWLRVNDRIVLEAAAIPAESFVVNVPDPPETELRAFFDEYKDRVPMPVSVAGVELPSPTPGFAEPQRVQVKYVRADFDKFITQLEGQITDEEIQEYYDKYKDPQFIKVDTDVFGETSSDSDATPAGEQTPNESPAADAADEEPAEEEEEEEESSEQDEQSIPLSVDPAAPAANEQRAASEAAEQPVATQPLGEEKPAVEEKPKEFQPLEEVRDAIRRRLAEQKVNEQLVSLMGELHGKLDNAYNRYLSATLDAEAAGKEPPPPPAEMADLKTFAEQHHLDYGETEELSFVQMRDHADIGRLYDTGQEAAMTQIPLVYLLFSKDTDAYKPIETFDFDNNRYIVVKVSEKAGRVPEFDEVRDQVLQSWKLREASKLALDRAKEYAEKAQSEGKPLKEFFADEAGIEVVQTDPFSWITTGSIAPQGYVEAYQLSQPEGIVAAGPEFMEHVFGLDENSVGAVLNFDQSIAYVVRIAEHLDSQDTLRRDFLNEITNWNGQYAMLRGHMSQATNALRQDLYSSADVVWERTPDQTVRED